MGRGKEALAVACRGRVVLMRSSRVHALCVYVCVYV